MSAGFVVLNALSMLPIQPKDDLPDMLERGARMWACLGDMHWRSLTTLRNPHIWDNFFVIAFVECHQFSYTKA